MACYIAWATDDEIRKKGTSGGFVTAALVSALENDLIDAALVVKRIDVYEGIPILTSDPEEVKSCAGSFHAVPVNLTKYVDPDLRIGMPAKPCDARGVIEQAKRLQIDLDKVFLIGLNCSGTMLPLAMRNMIEVLCQLDPDSVIKEEIIAEKLILKTKNGEKAIKIDEIEEKGYGRRQSCRYCNINIPFMADLACGNWGVPKGKKGTFVEIFTEKGETFFRNAVDSGAIAFEEAEEKSIFTRKRIDEAMKKLAEENWKKLSNSLDGIDRLSYYIKSFENCIGCRSCKIVCPVCACGEDAKCVSMDYETDSYRISMFNLVRLLHLMDSCIGCGQCEDVCPVDIPLTFIHRRFAKRIQDILDYVPGVNLEKPPFYETKLMEW
ncbi:MAG: Coenzyme F420 hydrogenase/dehydrogenase, beta subunit C-terminal domain [Candidatus Syntropharchaeia archaeon]